MIKVGFDISQLAHNGGVSAYNKNLTSFLNKIPVLEMVYFYSSLRKPFKGGMRNVKAYRLPPTFFEILFNKWRNVGIEKFIGPIDIFHSSDWTQPPSKTKKVTTIHDLVPLMYPHWSHPKIVEVFKRKIRLVEQEIDMVIAVSNSTKNDILKLTKIPKEKITVVYEGPAANFKKQPMEKVIAFKKKYRLPEKFVLAIGGIGERRNLARIKEACKDYNLVIAGVTLPWLSFPELELLYSSADVLLYCSLYEGFGIPILDAFSCELPVITSNVSSMPEVGGDAALYVDPLRVEDIREKLELVLHDSGRAQKMQERGFERMKKFSWESTAYETYLVYKKLSQ